MELRSIDTSLCETGADMIVTDIDGNDTDAIITLLGSESKVGRKLMLDFMRTIKEGKQEDGDSDKILSELTIGWKNIKIDGKEVKFTKEKALELYKEFPILKKQVDIFVSNQKNFLKK